MVAGGQRSESGTEADYQNHLDQKDRLDEQPLPDFGLPRDQYEEFPRGKMSMVSPKFPGANT